MNTIKNKAYIAPNISIYQVSTQHIVATSVLNPSGSNPTVTVKDDLHHSEFGARENSSTQNPTIHKYSLWAHASELAYAHNFFAKVTVITNPQQAHGEWYTHLHANCTKLHVFEYTTSGQ